MLDYAEIKAALIHNFSQHFIFSFSNLPILQYVISNLGLIWVMDLLNSVQFFYEFPLQILYRHAIVTAWPIFLLGREKKDKKYH